MKWKSAPSFRDERGSMIVQVAIGASLMLFVVLSGLKGVRVAMQSTNTVATGVAARDMILSLRQSLADTNRCMERLQPTAGGISSLIPLLSNPKATVPVKIAGPGGRVLAIAASLLTGPGTATGVHVPNNPDFEIDSVTLTGFTPHGRMSTSLGANRRYVDQYLGQVVIEAHRRNEFLGGAAISDSFPIILSVEGQAPHQVVGCSTRAIYQVRLGPNPGPASKTGLECVDRGGTPVQMDAAGPHYCRLPESSLNYCKSINTSVENRPPEGWKCDTGLSSDKVAYAY